MEIETETLEFKKSTGELKEAHEVGRIAISYTDKKTVLNQLELTAGDVLLNAGKALFSDDIVQDVQMAIFATSERLTIKRLLKEMVEENILVVEGERKARRYLPNVED